jgi:hypothetical protein
VQKVSNQLELSKTASQAAASNQYNGPSNIAGLPRARINFVIEIFFSTFDASAGRHHIVEQ